MRRIPWIWVHSRGGERVAQVAFEFVEGDDTRTFAVDVPLDSLLNLNKFCSYLLTRRLDLAGSEKPHEICDYEQLSQVIRHLELMHPKIWHQMLRAAKITSDKAELRNRIMGWMCRDPKGDDGTPPWEKEPA